MPNYFWTWQPCSGQRVVGHNGFIGFLKRCAAVSKPIIATHNEDIRGTRWPIEPLVYSCLRNVWNLEKHCVALRWSSPNCCWTYQRAIKPKLFICSELLKNPVGFDYLSLCNWSLRFMIIRYKIFFAKASSEYKHTLLADWAQHRFMVKIASTGERCGFNSECVFIEAECRVKSMTDACGHSITEDEVSLHSQLSKAHVSHMANDRFSDASYQRNKKHLLVEEPKLREGCNQPRGTDWILPSDGGDALQRNAASTQATGKGSSRITRGRARRMSLIRLWLFHINPLIVQEDIIKGFQREKLQS